MVLRFKREQLTYDIAGVKIGGQPGEYPTALVGSIFYSGVKMVKDAQKGIFDKDKATATIAKQDEMSKKTGIPAICDVVASTGEAMSKYVEFIGDATKAPMFVDSPQPDVRLTACKHAVEVGLKNRVVYSSISPTVTDKELEAIKELGLESCVILAFHGDEFLPEQKLELLQGTDKQEGLISKVKKAGIKNIFIDNAVLDVPSVAYVTASINAVKETLGLPCGCAPANVFDTWPRIKELSENAMDVCYASLPVFIQLHGADWLLYGPMKNADVVFPAVAMSNAIITYSGVINGFEAKTEKTPLYTIF